jgi:hypothetical protein
MRGRIRIVRVGEMPSSIAFYYEPSSFFCDSCATGGATATDLIRRKVHTQYVEQ